MPLVSVSDFLFMSDEFWGNSNLGSLNKLVLTCKGFRADLLGSNSSKKNNNNKAKKEEASSTTTTTTTTTSAPSVTEQAIAVMMERRPKANCEWMLTFSEAKFWFMLQVDTMVKFCIKLPEDNEFHLSEEEAQECVKKGGTSTTYYIRFLDAYRLTLNSGLKAAMERRACLYAKLVESANENFVFRQSSDIMRRNIKAAIIQLKKVAFPGAEVKKGIRLLEKLDLDVQLSRISRWSIEETLASSVWMKNVEKLKKHIADHKKEKRTLIARYKKHSVYCPEKMTMDCLARLEK